MPRRPAAAPPAPKPEEEIPHSDSFDLIAEVYDVLMRGVPYRTWASYYSLLLTTKGFAPKRLLDVACGTGTMALMLEAEGYEVAGFDLSPGMIEVARKKAYKRFKEMRFEVADAAEFDLGETFDGAYSFFDSLNNILDPERLEAAFLRIAAHLRPGGSWIFDLNTAYAFEKDMFSQRNLNPQARLRYDWRGHWEPQTREIRVDMRFWKDGEEFRETHRQRAYEEDEIVAMLARSGFEDVRTFHSYTLSPPRRTSDRIHYVCTRVEGSQG